MEVETRPPLVDGKLGFHSTRNDSDLRLAIAHDDILSDEEQELLKSPVEERLKPAILNGTNADFNEDVLLKDSSEKCSAEPKCNGFDEVIADDAFRTESEKCAVIDNPCEREESISSSSEKAACTEADVARESDLCDDGVGTKDVSDVDGVGHCDIDGLDGPEIVFDASDITVVADVLEASGAHDLEASKAANSEPLNDEDAEGEDVLETSAAHDLEASKAANSEPINDNDAEDEDVGEPTVLSVTCLGEGDVGDCPVVVAATSLPVEEEFFAEETGEYVEGTPEVTEEAGETGECVEATLEVAEDADEVPSLEGGAEKDDARNTVDAGDALETPAEEDTERPEEDVCAELAEGDEQGDLEPISEVEDVEGGDGETLGVVSAVESAENIDNLAVAETSMDVDDGIADGNMEDADEEMDSAGAEMDVDQGEEEGSPEYQGMTEDILPIIESELDADLDGQPEGEGSYDTEFERPDEESGSPDDESGCPDEVITDDISIHEEDSRMAVDVSPHESDDSQTAAGELALKEDSRPPDDGSIHESEDSREVADALPHASDDSRPASGLSAHASEDGQPGPDVAAYESDNSKPLADVSSRESGESKPSATSSSHEPGDNKSADASCLGSAESKPGATASSHESGDSKPADVSYHESGDSTTTRVSSYESEDSKPADVSSLESAESKPSASASSSESGDSKPADVPTHEPGLSRPADSTVDKPEITKPEGSTAMDVASVVKEELLEKLLSSKTPVKRRASVDALPGSPPLKIKRKSSLDGMKEDDFDTEKSFEEFRRLKDEKKPLSKVEFPATPTKLESKPEINDRSRITVDDDLDTSKELVIDLDEDEEKKKELLINEDKKEKKTEDEPTVEAPVRRTGVDCALDALFNGKDEITLSRKMFTKIMKSYVSQYMTTYSSFGKQGMRTALKAEDAMNKVGSNVTAFEKQKEELKMVMKKLLDDREASKQWDAALVPPKTTRSVGLQVCTVGNIYVPKNGEAADPVKKRVGTLPNPANAMMQQKIAYAQQQQAMMAARAQNANRPTAKKSTTTPQMARPGMNRLVPAPTPNRNAGTMVKTILPAQNYQQLNGVKPVARNILPESLSSTRPPNATLSPNGKTFLIGAKKVTVSPAKPPLSQMRTTINPALSRALGTALSPVVTTGKNQTTVQTPNRNIASGPGRPFNRTPIAKTVPGTPVTPVAIAQPAKKATTTPGTPVEATIDLTDDDGPQSSKAMPTTSAPGSRKPTSALAPANIVSVPVLKQMKHPALPPNPRNFNPHTAPPKPYLGICDTQQGTQGIMLTWHFNHVPPIRKVSKFEVYAYQESKSGADDIWKKVGDVDALPLPMACTLTQFREGYTYHFIVRAVDDLGNVGPYSAPNTITLMKKT